MINKEKLCEAEVRKNLVLAEIGEPLTLPLATLNRSCKFKEEWNRIQKEWNGKNEVCKYCGSGFKSKHNTKYCSTECRKKTYYMRHKVYREQPKIKKMISDRYKIYSQQPEIRARKKAYRERKKLKEIDNER